MRRMSFAPSNRIVQNCKESRDYCTIDCSGVISGGFLTSRGSPTGYYYTAQDSILTIYKYGESLSTSREIYKHNYGTGTMVVSASYFRLNANSEAVLVLIRQAKTATSSDVTFINCISLKTKNLIKSCVVSGKFNHMEVCIDGCQTGEVAQMKEGLRSLNNLIVIGGEETTAYFINLGPLSENTVNAKPVPPVKKVSLLRTDEDGFMEYRFDNGCNKFHPSTARVESLCYMSQRFTIAMGLSNGVIYFISFKSGRSDSVSLGASVEQLVVQHPLNDTDNSLFLWAQLQHREATHLIMLSTLPNDSKEANELLFIPRFSYSPPGCIEFLQFHSVVLSRKQAIVLGNSDEHEDDSSRDSSSSFNVLESSRFNQLMVFLYIERFNNGSCLRGSVFDLDGYYSRRMPREASVDRTAAQQCGFLSHFRAQELSFEARDSMDFLLADIGRFVPSGSLSAIDQHFYPSSLYFTFYLLSDQKAVEMRVPCLQDQVVNDVSKNFIEYYQAPDEITRFLHGVGLCNSLANENESVMRTCLFRILLHNYFPGCMDFLRREDTDVEILHFAHKWLGKEVEITKSRFDEEAKSLFSIRPADLPRTAILFAEHSQLVFRRAVQLYECLIERFQKLSADEEVMQRLNVNKKICEDLLLQISAILLGSHIDLLRETPENIERMNKLRIGFGERRSIAAQLGSDIQLEIYKIFDDIINASQGLEHYNELFGNRSSHELYPPESFTDLLDVLPHFSVNLSAKLQIFGYFTKDLDYFAPIAGQKISTFEIACGFLLNDNLASEAMSEMLKAWDSDMRLLRINQMQEVPGMAALKRLSDVDETCTEDELRFKPCTNKAERDALLKLYEQFPYGIHKFNLDMISRRRYEMIVDPPAQVQPNEPKEVKHSRNEVARIKRDFSQIFERQSFNKVILDKFREQQGRAPHMTVEPLSQAPLQIQPGRRHATKYVVNSGTLKDGEEIIEEGDYGASYEAFPPRTPIGASVASRKQSINQSTLDTTPPTHLNRFNNILPSLTPPIRRQSQPVLTTPINKTAQVSSNVIPPPSPYISQDVSKLIQNSAMKRKEMERLHRLTTPQSVRIRRESHVRSAMGSRKRPVLNPEDDVMHTPPSNSATQSKAPTSILRDNSNKRQRLDEEPRNIKFVEKQEILLIPSNLENRELQRAETSFTDFVALNDSSTDEIHLYDEKDFLEPDRSDLTEEQLESSEPVRSEPMFVDLVSPSQPSNDIIIEEQTITEELIIEEEFVEEEEFVIQIEQHESRELQEADDLAEGADQVEEQEIEEQEVQEVQSVTSKALKSKKIEIEEQEVQLTVSKALKSPKKSKKTEIEEQEVQPTASKAVKSKKIDVEEEKDHPVASKAVKSPKKLRVSMVPGPKEVVEHEKRNLRETVGSTKIEADKQNLRTTTPEPTDTVEDIWLKRNLRMTPERKKRLDRKSRVADKK